MSVELSKKNGLQGDLVKQKLGRQSDENTSQEISPLRMLNIEDKASLRESLKYTVLFIHSKDVLFQRCEQFIFSRLTGNENCRPEKQIPI